MSRIVCVLKTNAGGLWSIPQLIEIRRRDHDVVVVLPSGLGRLRRALDQQGFEIADSPFDFRFRPSRRMLTGLWRLRRLLRELKPDIVFYHLYASALAVRLSTLGLQLRRVHMVAGPLYLDSRPIRLAERWLCRMDTLVIGGSDYTAERYLRLGMPSPRVVAIPYGVDLVRYDRGPDLRTQLLQVPANSFVAIMVAFVYAPKSVVHRGVGIKGHELLLQAWESFSAERRNVHLVFVGAGFDRAGERHRQELIAGLKPDLRRSTIWLESVEDVRPYYSSADLSISPSLSENHGAVLEASAMGVPSLASDAGALPEAVLPGRTGWLFKTGDADGLHESLLEAHRCWTRGELPAYGREARNLMVRQFDQAACTQLVADAVLQH